MVLNFSEGNIRGMPTMLGISSASSPAFNRVARELVIRSQPDCALMWGGPENLAWTWAFLACADGSPPPATSTGTASSPRAAQLDAGPPVRGDVSHTF